MHTGAKTYYPAGGAMRVNTYLYYVLKDHASTRLSESPGSASVVTNSDPYPASPKSASGVIMNWGGFLVGFGGDVRRTEGVGTMYTDKLFTGQREMAGLGIYHYGARHYSPKLGRFLSADTIVPGYANPQNLNRFSYVTNNPLRYVDPSGHRARLRSPSGPDRARHSMRRPLQ